MRSGAIRALLAVAFLSTATVVAFHNGDASTASPSVGVFSSQSGSRPLDIQEHVLDNGFAILVVDDTGFHAWLPTVGSGWAQCRNLPVYMA